MAGSNVRDRSRSPRFPSYSLEDALSFASKLYDGVHRAPLDPDTAYQLMGFKGRSGASATALGALRQFGLIEGLSDKTRITDLALRILEPESSAEKIAAMQEAAESPEVFRILLERYERRIPAADEPIRAYLIRELGFSKVGAEQCLGSFRATMSLLSSLPASEPAHPIMSEGDEKRAHSSTMRLDGPNVSMAHTRVSASIPDLVFQLGGGRVAMIEIKGGPITARHLAQLERFLQVQRELLEEDDELIDET